MADRTLTELSKQLALCQTEKEKKAFTASMTEGEIRAVTDAVVKIIQLRSDIGLAFADAFRPVVKSIIDWWDILPPEIRALAREQTAN